MQMQLRWEGAEFKRLTRDSNDCFHIWFVVLSFSTGASIVLFLSYRVWGPKSVNSDTKSETMILRWFKPRTAVADTAQSSDYIILDYGALGGLLEST